MSSTLCRGVSPLYTISIIHGALSQALGFMILNCFASIGKCLFVVHHWTQFSAPDQSHSVLTTAMCSSVKGSYIIRCFTEEIVGHPHRTSNRRRTSPLHLAMVICFATIQNASLASFLFTFCTQLLTLSATR